MEDPLAYDASIEQPEAALAAIARTREQCYSIWEASTGYSVP